MKNLKTHQCHSEFIVGVITPHYSVFKSYEIKNTLAIKYVWIYEVDQVRGLSFLTFIEAFGSDLITNKKEIIFYIERRLII